MKNVILHMPHTGTQIPDRTGFVVSDDVIQREIDRVTDWGVSEIFNFDGITAIQPSFSRIFCDVERFYDDGEPLSKVGFGITYTHLECGGVLRELSEREKSAIINIYYNPHHEHFSRLVRQKLNDCGTALIVDCHSFPDSPLSWEEHPGMNRPDICIGTDGIHTPEDIKSCAVDYLSKQGYSVAVNHPFEGTIIPADHYGDKRVFSIMIEINRKLFFDELTRVSYPDKRMSLSKQMRNLINRLSQYSNGTFCDG